MYKSVFFRPQSASRPPFILAIAVALLGLGIMLQQVFLTRPVQAVSTSIVISEIDADTATAGTDTANEWFELQNIGAVSVTLTNWTITDNTATDTIPTVTLAPGGHVIVTGTAAGFAAEHPGFVGTVLAMGDGSIGNGLANGGDVLTLKDSSAVVVDAVSWGTNTSGLNPAPPVDSPTNTNQRNAAGADTDSAGDWTRATETPNGNTTGSGTTNPSGVGNANPNSALPGAQSLLTVTVTPGTGPASTGITVTGNLSTIGGSATQTFLDDGVPPDVTPGDNIFSFQATVAPATTPGLKTLPMSIADAQARIGSTNISLTVQGTTNPSVTGAASPSSVAQGANVTLTATVTPGTIPTSTLLAVTGDLSSIGGSAAQQFFDDGSNGDAVAGNNVFTFQTVVAVATTPGGKSLPLNVTDAEARSGSGSISLTVTPPAPAPGAVVISQVYGGGGNSGAPYQNDFIEIFNRSNAPVSLAGWSVQYASSAGTSWQTTALSGSLAPGQYYLVKEGAGTSCSGGPCGVVLPAFDASGSINMAAASGKVAVVSSTAALTGSCASGATVSDFVGYGGASCFEGATAAPTMDNVTSDLRTHGGCKDTDSNGGNFVSGAPSPRTTSTTFNVCPAGSDFEPEVFHTAPGSSEAHVALTSNITIDFDEPVNTTGSWFQISCTNTGIHTATVTGGPISFVLDPDVDFGFGEPCTVTIFASQVTDQDAIDPPDAMVANYVFTFTSEVAHDPNEHILLGNPNGAIADPSHMDDFLMIKTQYALSYNNTREIPNWTSWHLDSSWRGSAPRQDDFRNDTTLPPGFHQVLGTDYSGSGFDRGHMCPSADRTSTIPDNSATFLMDNMVPQAPGNNQGPWAALENYLRTFLPANELYIISGGTGVGGVGTNGAASVLASGVTVPAFTWKVALILPVGDNDVSRVDSSTRTIAVIMPNNTAISPDFWEKYLATVDQVEALTGYDFFNNVSPPIQSTIESQLDAGNDTAPVTTGQGPLSTPENQNLLVTLSATDFNVNNTFTYTIVTPPQHGGVSGTGANRTYSPAVNYVGPDSFTFKANDGALDSNTSTVSINVTAGTAVIPVTLPHVTGPLGSIITVPMTVGDVTGQVVRAYDLQVTFSDAIVKPCVANECGGGPTEKPFDKTGTLSQDMTVTANTNNTGHLIISAFQTDDMIGSGTLINLRFHIVGAPGQVSPTTFEDYTDPNPTFHPGFRFNAGSPASGTSNGSIHVNGPTAASAGISGQILDATGQPVSGTTVTITGGSRLIRVITDRNGFYRAENLEAGAFYAVTPSRANYLFSPGSRGFSLVGDRTDAVFTGTAIGPDANPLESPEFFVRQQYLDFLGREPDQGGLDYWSGQLRACGNDLNCVNDRRIGVSGAFFVEREFQESGLFIYDLYRGALGRRPDRSEYATDRTRVVGGPTLETEKREFAAAFVARTEFVQQYPLTMNADLFVDALLQKAQETSGLDLSAGRVNLIALYHSSANISEARSAVLRSVTEGEAFKQSQFNSAFVVMEYFNYLGRNPEAEGYSFWLNVLNNADQNNYRGMICSFITSTEYQQRFSPVVMHSNAECGIDNQ